MKFSQDVPITGRQFLKLTHHLSILGHEGRLLMLSLIPLDPTQQVKVVTVSAAELARVFAFIGGRATSAKKSEAAGRNGRKGGRPRKQRI